MSTYAERAELYSNPTAKRLLLLMDEKKTNLSVAVDVTTKKELLHLADILGPSICVLKTHIDIVEDFDYDLVEKLLVLQKKHNFLIFEDRKFADIGNTVKLQYSKGVYRIADWADITNAHPIPGEGIVDGLKEVGLKKGRALLILAEMSSAGTLAKGQYSIDATAMAEKHRDFCIGFIGQNPIREIEGKSVQDFIYMTPGVGLVAKGDALGQQYRTPHQVIHESGCDVIIVGRGIYGSGDAVENAKQYREAGWEAYLARLKK
ncbi:orotidine 5'-phosphate decarboxylase [Terramyces sp. JEL0728]|nr:orotidine 5'-phosphate decarboxylase [Terramyces sp. JEL0728]